MDENLPVTPGIHREDSFETVVRGYNRRQVMEYMAKSSQLLATLEQHLAVARADAHRARAEAEQAQAELARLQAEPVPAKPVHEEVSARLSQILRLAAEEAAQERETAEAEIGKLHTESQAEAERVITEAKLTADRELAEARETAERELGSARSAAEQELGDARQEADRLRQASIRQAEELIDNAQRRAGAVNEVSNQRLETLTATHGEAVLRLGQIRDVLADLLQRDDAAGSLAQVVEAVIAPAGTSQQLDAGAATELHQPVAGTAVQAAVTDGADDQPYIDSPTSSSPYGASAETPAEPVALESEPVVESEVEPAAVSVESESEVESGVGSGVGSEPVVESDPAPAAVELPDSTVDEDQQIDLREASRRLAGEASRR